MKLPTNQRYKGSVGIAVFALLVAFAAGSLTPSPASAQEDKKDVTIKEYKRKKEPKKKAEEQKGPSYKIKSDEREFKLEAQKKRDEAIKLLIELIESTDDTDEEKPEFLFQLSELLWAKSKYYEQKAFQTQDKMYQANDQKDRAGADRYKSQMAQELAEAKKLRQQAVKVYAEIIRNHKNFKQLDKVYFYLGVNLLEIGKRAQALTIFRELIKAYPDSAFMPNVLLAFGEYYFDNDDMDQAMKAYQKVVEFKNSDVRTYAMYKMAWCLYNLTQYDQALNQFYEVVKIAEKSGKKADRSLHKEALRDIVLTYSHIGKASKAIPFFQKLVSKKSDVLYMGERLAQIYADSGQLQQSTELYRKLISMGRGSIVIMPFQIQVVHNTEALGIKVETVREVLRAMKLFEIARGYEDAKPDRVAEVQTQLEQILREYATTYHREAQKTKQEDTYAMSYELYKAYLEAFPNPPDKYTMTFFYAELLYHLKKYDEAAVQYDAVLQIDPKGQYTKEAVHASVLSYQKMVDADKHIKEYEANKEGDVIPVAAGEDEKEPPKVEPKAIPESRQKLIAACDRYAKHNPDGDGVVKVKYSAARTYYDYDHHDEAMKRFHDIVVNHSADRIAIIAANLHLDSLVLTHDYATLSDTVEEYLKIDAIAQGELLERLNAIAEKAAFKKCNQVEASKDWEAAAKCFTNFYRAFPESEMVDKALFNAALDYERKKMLGKAIQVRKGLLQLRPDSELVPETLYAIGGNYHAIAVYSEASKFYELFVEHFPKHEKAEGALGNAATFRQGLGQYDKAIENYEKYLTLFPEKKEKCAEVFFQIGMIYEKEGRKKEALDHWGKYLQKWARVGRKDRELQCLMKLAMNDWAQGAKGEKAAVRGFEKTLKVYSGLREAQRNELEAGADAAAQARFMIGESKFRELRKIKLKLPEKLLQKRLIEKIKGYDKTKAIYSDVFKFSRPDWTIAALYRIGSLFQDFANEIRNSPVPKQLTREQVELYKGGLEEKASDIETQAIELYETCLDVALKKSWFNQYTKKAEVALAGLKPREYRKPSELRSAPDRDALGLTRAEFEDKAVKEEAVALPEQASN